MLSPAVARQDVRGWGSSALRRATFTLATTQLISWGVLFYGFAVVAPQLTVETGWSESAVSGAFSVGLLVSGLAAPAVARLLTTRDVRIVLTAGSVVGALGMVLFAAAGSLPLLYGAWIVVGAAMAVTLYEPAVVVLVGLDPARRLRTITVLTVVGGLASTVYAPLIGGLTDQFGWRSTTAVVAVTGGAVTALLHAAVLPASPVARRRSPSEGTRADPMRGALARLRAAVLFEQAAIVATSVHLIGVLADRGASIGSAALVLGAIGIGKVPGRLLMLGPTSRLPFPVVAAACNVAQLAGFGTALVTTSTGALLPAALIVGAAAGTTTVLRPLLVVDLVGVARFAAVSARIQRATVVARAGAPFVVGVAVSRFGWTIAWALALVAFGFAAQCYVSLHRSPEPRAVF